MALPSKPVRKAANVETDAAGRVRAGSNQFAPAKRSAEPYGSVDKSVYKHPSVGITPGSVPINDKDAGRGTGNARGGVRKHIPDLSGVD